MGRIVFIVLVVAVIIAIFLPDSRMGEAQTVPASVRHDLQGHQVVMLSATWCGYCKRLKADLREAKIPFKVLDIENTTLGRQVAKELDIPGVPTTIIGDQVISGYEPDDIIELARALPTPST